MYAQYRSAMGDKTRSIRLAAGNEMPLVGIGFWQSSPEETIKTVDAALDAGYHLIDTALAYQNEQEIGDTLKKRFQSGKNTREDVFITTKAASGLLETPELLRKSFNRSLAALQVDYVDLYLIHGPIAFKTTPDEQPLPLTSPPIGFDHLAAWKAMEQLVDEGKVKAIGLSNFNSKQIEHIHASARIPISNVQVECHLYFQQENLYQFCKERNITLTAYSPLGSPGTSAQFTSKSMETLPGPLKEALVLELSKKYKKTPAQILLRQTIQRGIAVIPKSVNPIRIKENFDVFDFTISQEDMKKLSNFTPQVRMFSLERVPGIADVPGYPFSIPF